MDELTARVQKVGRDMGDNEGKVEGNGRREMDLDLEDVFGGVF
jgi:hypothetical protein